MRHIYLLRHAKASWELAGELDYERGLTERGANDCVLMRGPVEALTPAPDLVICSGARRARETLDGVAAALPKDTVVEYDDRIYQATTDRLIDVLRGIDPGVEAVLMVGHNPSMHDLAVELAADGPELDAIAGKFPTAALAELEFEGEWSQVGGDCAQLGRFTRAKMLRSDQPV